MPNDSIQTDLTNIYLIKQVLSGRVLIFRCYHLLCLLGKTYTDSSIPPFDQWLLTLFNSFHFFLSLMAYHSHGNSFPKVVLWIPPSTHIQFLSFSQLMPLPHTSLSKRKQLGRDSLIFPPSKLANFSINFLTWHSHWFYCGWNISTSIKVQSSNLRFRYHPLLLYQGPLSHSSCIINFSLSPATLSSITLQTYYIVSDPKSKNKETKDFLIPYPVLATALYLCSPSQNFLKSYEPSLSLFPHVTHSQPIPIEILCPALWIHCSWLAWTLYWQI